MRQFSSTPTQIAESVDEKNKQISCMRVQMLSIQPWFGFDVLCCSSTVPMLMPTKLSHAHIQSHIYIRTQFFKLKQNYSMVTFLINYYCFGEVLFEISLFNMLLSHNCTHRTLSLSCVCVTTLYLLFLRRSTRSHTVDCVHRTIAGWLGCCRGWFLLYEIFNRELDEEQKKPHSTTAKTSGIIASTTYSLAFSIETRIQCKMYDI